ncbi:MAG: hypothetical protein ACJ8F7_20980 [Gemmataceae bacterium]
MRRLWIVALLLLAGCQNTIGPLQNQRRDKPDDPYYNISQQQYRGRDRYSRPDDSFEVGPKTGIQTYGPTGR